MRISVIGCGYLGTVHASAMAALGHDVIGIDVDDHKIGELAQAGPPFFEPGLPEILTSATATGLLRFSTDLADAAGAGVHFVAVGTPQTRGTDAADLRYVDAAIESLLPHLAPGALVVARAPCLSARRRASPPASQSARPNTATSRAWRAAGWRYQGLGRP
ncbi:hypothetical protein [Agromyces albus]|uniref:hypothetical protein n=1 Tax=Agromyces albus TaxID=205332 RepID=UPI00278A1854|nr:UDP-glucose 6-dehydrogenase [Agromyces albus]